MDYKSIADLCSAAEEKGAKISELVLEDEAASLERPAEELMAIMDKRLEVMQKSVAEGSKPSLRSVTLHSAKRSTGSP